MKDPQVPMNGALWASSTPTHGRMSMKMAVGVALAVEALLILGISQVNFHHEPPPARREIRVEMAPPPPPPPPVVKKLEPPPTPLKPITPIKPKPTVKPPPAMPSAAPKEANIQAAAHPAADAPALATANATPGPATAATGVAPAPPPGLHGVVDGRGHCQTVEPQMPRRALEQGISATVIAHLSIAADGSVSNVQIVRATPPTTVFNQAVVAAAQGFRCEKNPDPYVGEVAFTFKTTAGTDDQ
jgi:protein TonB